MKKMWRALGACGLAAAVLCGCMAADREEPVAVQMTPEQEAFMQKELERQAQMQSGMPMPPAAQQPAPPAPAQ